MAYFLVMSYVLGSLIFLEARHDGPRQYYDRRTVVSASRLIGLGVFLLLRTSIAVVNTHSTPIQTYNIFPLDITAALSDHCLIDRAPGRCMHAVFDEGIYFGPRKPLIR